MPLAISAAIAGGADLLKTGYGIYQTAKGNSDYNSLLANRPQRTTDPNILYNQQLAQNIASQGIPDSAKNYYTDNINKALGSGINAILEGGGDLNMINSLVGGATNSYKSMLAQDAQQKLANQGVLMQANQNVANQNQENWNWNKADPYLTNLARATQQTNSGITNIAGGLQDLAGTANAYGLSQSKANSTGTGNNYTDSQYGLNAGWQNEGGITDTSYPATPQNGGSFSPNTAWALGSGFGH
jgi:hypothetical protein